MKSCKTIKIVITLAVLILQLLSLNTIHAKQIRVPLNKLFPVEAIDLKCVESEYVVTLPIPNRWNLNDAKLEFKYTNSASLVRQKSQLVVRLNGTPLAQIKLDPNAPEGMAEIVLPTVLMQAGYNKLSFSVSQHSSLQCEMLCAPELWTHIKLDEAMITLDYDLKEVPTKLSAIANFLFDGRSFVDNRVHIISESRQDEILSLSGVIASGIAARYDYQTVEFSTSDDLRDSVDNILIGTADFVRQFLAEREIDIDVDSPFIKIFHMPRQQLLESGELIWQQDTSRALLVVSGLDLKQLRLAVESFAIISLPFPDSSTMKVHEFNLPEIGLYTGKEMVNPEQQYTFGNLNFNTKTYRGFSSGTDVINFRVPPDFLIKPNQYVNIALNFAYGSGYRSDSVLNILINGKYVSSILLDNIRGSFITNYELALPTFLFNSGINTLAFQPVLTPLVTENCSFIQSENLFLTLFDSSSITFPKMPHRVEMPRLDLMFVNGFPFTRWPDGHDALVYLPSTDNESLTAAYNMIGMLTQKNGYPLFSIKMTSSWPDEYQGELLVIGDLDTIPQKLLDLAPLKSGKHFIVPYPVFKGFKTTPSFAYSTQESGISTSKGLLMQFESPWKTGRSVVLMTGKTTQSVEHLSRALLEPSVQANIRGDLTMIDFLVNDKKDGDKWKYVTTSVNTGNSYISGKGGEATIIDSYLSTHPAAFWAVVISIVLLISLLSYWLLRHYRTQREQE